MRGGEVLERLAHVDLVAFDKTGTLTAGAPRLVAITLAPESDLDEDALLALAAAVESRSEQPLAHGIVDAARERGLALAPVQDFEAAPGRGVCGRVSESDIALWSPRAALERGVDRGVLERLVAPHEERGESTVVVLRGGALVGVLGLRDAPREGSRRAIEALRGAGLEVALLSGDRAAAANSVAGELGIEQVRGGLLPEEKAAALAAWRREGRRVLMVGDGINDAPALAAADVGIALGGGTDIALDTSDGALLRDEPEQVVTLLALARRTLSTIRANLVWAFGYNLVALPAAAGLLERWLGDGPSPTVAAAAMSISSLAVVLNSLRLRRARLRL